MALLIARQQPSRLKAINYENIFKAHPKNAQSVSRRIAMPGRFAHYEFNLFNSCPPLFAVSGTFHGATATTTVRPLSADDHDPSILLQQVQHRSIVIHELHHTRDTPVPYQHMLKQAMEHVVIVAWS